MPDGNRSTRGERALARLLDDGHFAPPDQLAGLTASAGEELGARDVQLFVVDHGQTRLVRLEGGAGGESVPVDGTMAGRAFRLVQPQLADAHGGQRVWVPLLDGVERLGVIALTFDAVDDQLLEDCRRLASVLANLVISKSHTGDALHRAARRQEMTLAAEMQWSLMPPLTSGTDELVVAAMLEPSYEVGGDLVDYAFDSHIAHLAVMDAMGHGLQASLLSALAVGAYRNRRRAGDDLPEMAMAMETAIRQQFADARFVTAILAVVDTTQGVIRWVNAGHPPALLLREGRVIKELAGVSGTPLGVGLNTEFRVFEEHLQPGDRILFYTDGVVEARTPAGELFGLERLVDFVVRADASAEPIPETMRRLSRAVLEHQQGNLRDDATQMLLEWRTGAATDIAERYRRVERP